MSRPDRKKIADDIVAPESIAVPPIAGATITLEWIPVGRLRIDDRYERNINQFKVRFIADNFDPDKVGLVYVSRRDVGDFIIDGQHRTRSVQRLWGDTENIQCAVYHGLTPEGEASIFAAQEYRTKPRPVDLYKAKVFAGDRVASRVQNILDRHKLRVVTGGKAHDTLQAIDSVILVFEAAGELTLDRTLSAMKASWSEDDLAWNTNLIKALGLIIARHEKDLDFKRFITTLGRHNAASWNMKAGTYRAAELEGGVTLSAWGAMAKVLVAHYNRGLRANRIVWSERGSVFYWESEKLWRRRKEEER